MQPSEFIYKKMASLEQSGVGRFQETAGKPEPTWQMPRAVVHQLNNMLITIQSHADHLLSMHDEDPDLQTPLRAIFESARRAATLMREAAPSARKPARGENPPSSPSPA